MRQVHTADRATGVGFATFAFVAAVVFPPGGIYLGHRVLRTDPEGNVRTLGMMAVWVGYVFMALWVLGAILPWFWVVVF